MSYTAIDICNLALSKLGGAGDQVGATGQITSLADTDRVSVWCNTTYPKSVEQVIIDMAMSKAPIRKTVRQAELDNDLTDDDVVISDISVGSAPDYQVTITTDDVHGKTTGDTIVLKGIDGDGHVSLLNGPTRIITVVDTTSFTLNQYSAWLTLTVYALGDLVTNGGYYYRCLEAHTSGTFATDLAAGKWSLTKGADDLSATGDSEWDYSEDSGIVSNAPEMGPWTYAYDLPSECKAVVRVTDEIFSGDEDTRKEYRFTTIRNKDDDGDIILTNELTNADGDGIYIEYVVETITSLAEDADTTLSVYDVDAIATFQASELAPVVGRNMEVRMAILMEYKKNALPAAMAFNLSQQNLTAKKTENFRGGRRATIPNP